MVILLIFNIIYHGFTFFFRPSDREVFFTPGFEIREEAAAFYPLVCFSLEVANVIADEYFVA